MQSSQLQCVSYRGKITATCLQLLLNITPGALGLVQRGLKGLAYPLV